MSDRPFSEATATYSEPVGDFSVSTSESQVVLEERSIFGNTCLHMTPQEARRVAALLHSAADNADSEEASYLRLVVVD